MTTEQHMIMWLGLALIALNLFGSGQWQEIWSSIGVKQAASGQSNEDPAVSGVQNRVGKSAAREHRPNPGSVQGRL